MIKITKVFLLLLLMPLSNLSADTLTNDQVVDALNYAAGEIGVVARMGDNCAESIDGGFFNTAWERCSRFVPAFNEVYENNKDSIDYIYSLPQDEIGSFCRQAPGLLTICSDIGLMMQAYDKAVTADRLGAFN